MLLKLPQAAAGVWAEAVLTSEGSTEGGSTSKLPTALPTAGFSSSPATGPQASALHGMLTRLLSFSCCYQLNVCVPQKSHVEAPTPSMAVLGDAASKEVRIREGVRVGP